ncbi:MAG TPA: PQQ-binding-like beta-propeller repeat protein, partial [Sumerlaeia bacterium]|nr:PQQ-binding-like beta-propeller repeat protein [Sumerlaeia bacterium]
MKRIFQRGRVSAFRITLFALALSHGPGSPRPGAAADWPMWRCDAGRTAASPETLPAPLHLQWVRELGPAKPAWPPSQTRLQFDVCYEPVAMGKKLFVPSNVTDSVTAYHTETGEEAWRFFADGPVRFAPVAAGGRVWFGSDDGCVYCLDAASGRLLWRFLAGPSDKKAIGNQRLGSAWPVRGGPVLVDGALYFAASIWPFMGIFYYALDAETGEEIWSNSGTGMEWKRNPHGAMSFSNLVPQGCLAATGDYLVVPGGRSTAGVLDRKTGKLLHFLWGGGGGGPVFAQGERYYNAGMMFGVADGNPLTPANPAVLSGETTVSALYDEGRTENILVVHSAVPVVEDVQKIDRMGRKSKTKQISLREIGRASCPAPPSGENVPLRLFIKAARQFFLGGEGVVVCVEMDPGSSDAATARTGAGD